MENYLRTACEQGWLRATVLRISNAYGALLAAERRQGLMGVAMARVLAGQTVKVFGSLETIRDYVHVDDVARAFGKGLGIPGKGENYSVFNIAAGRGHSVAEVLELIGRATGREVRLEQSDFGKAALGLLPRVVLANAKAREELGWQPEITLEEGVREMIFEPRITRMGTDKSRDTQGCAWQAKLAQRVQIPPQAKLARDCEKPIAHSATQMALFRAGIFGKKTPGCAWSPSGEML